jgi:hypothetical protein
LTCAAWRLFFFIIHDATSKFNLFSLLFSYQNVKNQVSFLLKMHNSVKKTANLWKNTVFLDGKRLSRQAPPKRKRRPKPSLNTKQDFSLAFRRFQKVGDQWRLAPSSSNDSKAAQ